MVHVILASAVLIALLGKKRSRYALPAGFFVLFMFAALRYMYGNDYRGYLSEYNAIRQGWRSQFDDEVLFKLLNQISPSFYILIAITSLIFILAVYKLVKQNLSRRYAWMGLFIFAVCPYIFLVNLSSVRQCLAMVVFMAAVRYGMERKWLPYVLLIVISALFHKSAVILLPVYLILGGKQFKKWHAVIVLAGILLLTLLVDFNALIQRSVGWFKDANYIHYANSEQHNSLRATLLTGIYFAYVLLNMDKLEGKQLVYAKLSLIGYGVGILAFQVSMLTRIQMYFDIFTIITIPTIMETINAKGKIPVNLEKPQETVWRCVNKYVFPTLIIMVYFLRYYSFFTTPTWEAFYTYKTIFSIM